MISFFEILLGAIAKSEPLISAETVWETGFC